MNTKLQVLSQFISPAQRSILTMLSNPKEDESAHFIERVEHIAQTIENMPKTYETDGQGMKAIAYLHYFIGAFDFYITEKDCEQEQLQAFGLISNRGDTELGYISLQEITQCGAELDLYWTPTALSQIKY